MLPCFDLRIKFLRAQTQRHRTAPREGLIAAPERPSATPRDRTSLILQRGPSILAASVSTAHLDPDTTAAIRPRDAVEQ